MPDDPNPRLPYIDWRLDSWKLTVLVLLLALLAAWALFWPG
jgi:hypothetical protein